MVGHPKTENFHVLFTKVTFSDSQKVEIRQVFIGVFVVFIIVKEFCFADIKIYSIDEYTPGKALNLGVSKTSRENLLILSAHSQITKMVKAEEIDNLLFHQCVLLRVILEYFVFLIPDF